jgi:hypothetical protein
MCQQDNNNALSGCIIITHSSSLTKFSAMVSLIGTAYDRSVVFGMVLQHHILQSPCPSIHPQKMLVTFFSTSTGPNDLIFGM